MSQRVAPTTGGKQTPTPATFTIGGTARELADGPRWAIRWTKVSVNKVLKESVNLVLDTSLAFEEVSMKLPDHQEATRAFVEKRKPVFTGK